MSYSVLILTQFLTKVYSEALLMAAVLSYRYKCIGVLGTQNAEAMKRLIL
jgi:hypothetical protein